jgi:hypothetical protein
MSGPRHYLTSPPQHAKTARGGDPGLTALGAAQDDKIEAERLVGKIVEL